MTLRLEIVEWILWWLLFGAAHELAHLLAACAVGCARGAFTWPNLASAAFGRQILIPQAPKGWRAAVVQHAGWLASSALAAAVVTWGARRRVAGPAVLTMSEALVSDLFAPASQDDRGGWYFCGNFGMIILDEAWTRSSRFRARAKAILQKMIEVTMMRGAQSGGVVTFVGAEPASGLRGVRCRVVNTKRGDLSVGVRAKLDRGESWAGARHALRRVGRVYAGHTRFATTSKATFDGTHPHQWTPPRARAVWRGFHAGEPARRVARCHVENFVCHNGDLDFFTVGGKTFDLGTVQEWLPRATGAPMPSPVDSCAVAGLVDLLRTKGLWYHSVRYGYLFGALKHAGPLLDAALPSRAALESLAAIIERE